MPCYYPLQAFRLDSVSVVSGKRGVRVTGGPLQRVSEDSFAVPCGRCMGCRLETSRQKAVRCMHEAQLYDENCFITLTFDEKFLAEMCPGRSLVMKHCQDFMKRLRQRFSDRKVRVFYCGEYGECCSVCGLSRFKCMCKRFISVLGRPHYHFCLFNCDFPDREYLKSVGGFDYFTSVILSELWPFGHVVVCNFSFETAAYVARYCCDKVNGLIADKHYGGRLPEFSQASLKPGLGKAWLDRFGGSDVFSFDEVIVRGVSCKPPRYYDKCLERKDPLAFDKIREARIAKAVLNAGDNTPQRLRVREKCLQARIKNLVRGLDSL